MSSRSDKGGGRHAPELLSPAGDWECARAAVANGADAIYFGLPAFNARLRATNFTLDELPELMRFLHEHGVRGFVTMNTLIFSGELAGAEAQLRALDAAGVDAVIAQDLGLARLAKQVAPNVELHASTQMTITSPEGLALVDESVGLSLAVLARETSMREMASFGSVGQGAVPLEVFVHGALCVAYSGQCLTSESLGQRSANRGECAQACRMEYELIVDGEKRELGARSYLLSPQDLAAVDQVAGLIDLGIASFKIEGRLKSPEYVAAVTGVYRKAIDAAVAGRDVGVEVSAEDRYSMEMTFSRGFHSGWMEGVDNKKLVLAKFGKKRGALLGVVVSTGVDFVEMVSGVEVKVGDGVVFDSGGDTDREQGGNVYEVREAGAGNVQLFFKHGHLRFRKISAGDRVWKTSDPALNRRLRSTWAGKIGRHRREGLRLKVSGRAGEPLRLEALGRGVVVESMQALEVAERRPLDGDVLRKQLGRLGETAYELAELENAIEGEVMLPLSALNRLRRALVEAVDAGGVAAVRKEGRGGLASLRAAMDWGAPQVESAPELTALCRTMGQIEVACDTGVGVIAVDFEDIRRYRDAVELVRDRGAGVKVVIATPRIQKPGEEGFFKVVDRAGPDGVLLRNLGGVAYFRDRLDLLRIGDFSLNVANPLSADYFLGLGLDRVTVSYDLAVDQVVDMLVDSPDPARFELTLHQHMPMFHMEHCVFCAFMSEGTDVTNCGRPCDRHEVHLRDRVGMLHPLKADVGCRNTLFNGKAQTGAKHYDVLRAAGLRRFRVDLLDESPEEARAVLEAYRALLAGEESGAVLWRSLRAIAKLGVTVGSLEG